MNAGVIARNAPLSVKAADLLASIFRPGSDIPDEGVDVAERARLERSPEAWLRTLFADRLADSQGNPIDLAPHHKDFWAWIWSLEAGKRQTPFVAIWPRGGGKSSSGEMGVVAVGAMETRRYVLYVSETQDQADQHISAIGGMLESDKIAAWYPSLGERMVGKYGHSKGWRRNRLRTSTGFTVDAIGLDTAARGVKMDSTRPDLIILDDIDGEDDTPETTKKKVDSITRKLLPAGAEHLAVLAIQNLVSKDGVFGQLVSGKADFLHNRTVSGPVPAILNATFDQVDGRWFVTGGTATWEGQSLEICQSQIDEWGYTSFRLEAQHDVDEKVGGMFSHLTFTRIRGEDLPDLVRTTVWCDPAVSETDNSDSNGIQVDGLGPDGRIYRLWSFEERSGPLATIKQAIRLAWRFHSPTVGVETDQGGDTWESVYNEACRELDAVGERPDGMGWPRFESEKAGGGYGSKTHRAQQMLADYERGAFIHVMNANHTHLTLEQALRRFPKYKPFDLTDAAYWSWLDLRGLRKKTTSHGGLGLGKAKGW